MKTTTDITELRHARAQLGGVLGLVPTMGFLHAGHLSLVELARRACQHVAVSIFVNPSQFGPNEDLDSYPRDIERDLQLLAEAGVDLVWMPEAAMLYPPGYQTWIDVEAVSQPLEGTMRPGHFRGVATIVAKLFNAVYPQRAYFGQKDAQQVAVIERMAHDLNFPVEIVIGPIVRAADGLALSSRNAYLNAEERRAALVLHKALAAAKTLIDGGERHAERVRTTMGAIIQAEPLARLQYVSCADPATLQELEVIDGDALLSMAVYIGKTRLIDNFVLHAGVWLASD